LTVPVRQYAGIVGIAVLALGIVGMLTKLISASDYLFNLLNVSWAANMMHLVTGWLMAYISYKQNNVTLARYVVGLLGIIYLLVFVAGLISTTVFGLVSSGLTWADNMVHLVLGLAGILAAYMPGRSAQLGV
jgi:hypothetical protein